MLVVDLEREIPEGLKPRKIEMKSTRLRNWQQRPESGAELKTSKRPDASLNYIQVGASLSARPVARKTKQYTISVGRGPIGFNKEAGHLVVLVSNQGFMAEIYSYHWPSKTLTHLQHKIKEAITSAKLLVSYCK